jgi:EmrB/QacA subfamily drug resistance transporter
MAQAGRSAVGLRSERGPVLGAIMLSTALVALDSTIIATAVPSVVSDLGGFSQFPWVFSIYLLTQSVTVPLYGKFADLFGRKPVMLFGIVVFLFGSVLCGAAWSMPVLIAARAVQGIGAGAVQPISMTMLGDLYTLEERARVQGYVTSIWGGASLVGPALGGVFAEYISWRWIFYINVPLGILAIVVLVRKFSEKVERQRRKIDYTGSALLTVGLSLVLLGLLEGGVAWAWDSVPSVGVFAVGVAVLVAFGFVERKAAEPVLPLWVFKSRTLVGGNLMALIVGAMMMGLSSYLPTFVEGVIGTGALVAGFTLAAMTIGWPIAATMSGHAYMRIGLRNTALIGAVFVITGAILVGTLGPETQVWQAGGAAFLLGVAAAGCGNRDQHVQPVPGQCDGSGRVRRHRQRDTRRPVRQPDRRRGREAAVEPRRDQPGPHHPRHITRDDLHPQRALRRHPQRLRRHDRRRGPQRDRAPAHAGTYGTGAGPGSGGGSRLEWPL